MSKTNTIDEINAAFGKIPPQVPELEKAVLGALMLERDAFYSVNEFLNVDSFYSESHQIIFSTIESLIQSGKPIDLLMVTQALKAAGTLEQIGGPMYITELTSRVATAAHIEHHARIIFQAATARKLIRVCTERMTQAYDETLDIDETLSGLQNDLIGLFETGKNREFTIADAISDIKKRIDLNQRNTGLSGIGTGLYQFDKFTGGLQKTDLIIIAGESSQGKTSLALTMLKNAVLKFGAKAAVYSLEMSKSQLVARIIAQETNISAKKILNKFLSKAEIDSISDTAKRLVNLPVFFDESSSSTIDQICSSIRKLKIKHDIDLVVVDYLQLVSSGLKNRTDESQLADIARRLKNIAKELNISVIALSQLSRDRSNPKPMKSRLRGSGQIEEAADIVLMVWRPETYDIYEFGEPFKGTKTKGLAEAIIEKGRNIGIGCFLLQFNPETTGFYDYEPRLEVNTKYNPDAFIESGSIR